MRCPNCSNPMLLLFTSYVCDTCNPPKGQVAAPVAAVSPLTGWVRVKCIPERFEVYPDVHYPGLLCDFHIQTKSSLSPTKGDYYVYLEHKGGIKLTWCSTLCRVQGNNYYLSALCKDCYRKIVAENGV